MCQDSENDVVVLWSSKHSAALLGCPEDEQPSLFQHSDLADIDHTLIPSSMPHVYWQTPPHISAGLTATDGTVWLVSQIEDLVLCATEVVRAS